MLEHIEIANPYGPNTRPQSLRGGAQFGGHAARRDAAFNHCLDFGSRKSGLHDPVDRHARDVRDEEELLRFERRRNRRGGLVGIDVERADRRSERRRNGRHHRRQSRQE